MTVDRDVVGRVGKDQARRFVLHQVCVGRWIAGIGAKQAVVAEVPEVAEPGDRLRLDGRKQVASVHPFRLSGTIDKEIDLGGLKPRHFQIEVDLRSDQLPPQDLQLIHFPVGVEGNLVVGQARRRSFAPP